MNRLPVLLAALALPALAWAAGPFKVGVTTLTFTKTSVTNGTPRPLETTIWYPAAPRTGTADPLGLGLRDAAVRRGRHPLIMFSHGACGRPTESTYFTTALARAGYVVAAPRHPGNTADEFPACAAQATFVDSALNRVPDVRFVVDAMLAEDADASSRFAGHLDPDAIGMSGLSFGGYTTLLGAQQEPRFRAALAMVPGGSGALAPDDITIPTMVIGAEHDAVVTYAESERAYARLAGPRFLVKLLAANHLSVVDDCFNHDLGVSFCVGTDITQDEAHRLVLRYALPFFRRYLAEKRVPGRALRKAAKGVELQAVRR